MKEENKEEMKKMGEEKNENSKGEGARKKFFGKKDGNDKGGDERETEELMAQIAELTGDLQRTRADFENYRKQVEIQKAQAMDAARYATIMKVLPLLDNLDLAIRAHEELGPLLKTLEKVLKELKLEKIASEEGVEFNPDLHEAVMMEEGEGEKEIIAETLRPGYYYEGAVLRPAMVKVRRG